MRASNVKYIITQLQKLFYYIHLYQHAVRMKKIHVTIFKLYAFFKSFSFFLQLNIFKVPLQGKL